MTEEFLTAAERTAAVRMADDLARVFADRLRLLVAYEPVSSAGREPGAVHTLALVDSLALTDLAGLLTVVTAWHKAGLATPLLLSPEEFDRTLDVFPIEYQSILSRHVVIRGAWHSDAIAVASADLRRGCERQIKGHLIHLREGYLETHGRPSAIAELVRASVPAFRSALQNIARLRGAAVRNDEELSAFAESALGTDGAAVRDVLAFRRDAQAAADLLPRYIAAVERLWRTVDRDGA